MGAGADGHETPQGALPLGAEQVPPERRAYRTGAEGAAQIKSKRSSEPDSRNEPPSSREPYQRSEPTDPREPKEESKVKNQPKRRPINIPHDPSESQLHQSIAELLDWILIEPALYTTFPAGWGKLTRGTAGRLFASGLKKGMPDILVFDKCQKVVGIELKAGRNSVTSAQRAMFARLQAVGITVYVCRSQEDVLAALCRESISHRSMRHSHAGTHTEVTT